MTRQHLVEKLGLYPLKEDFQCANETQVREAENVLGFELPADYRAFLSEFGVSGLSSAVVFAAIEPSPWAADGKDHMGLFYGISDDPDFDVCSVNADLRGDIPDDSIAIAHDSGANHLLLFRNNQVRFFDNDSGKTFLCARSFEDFLKLLEVETS
jgi:hypothetical protein